eukprot:TRINITY_DN1151_c0_g1_i1.p1 TRINITY_DN1151_c0_g1~~TRINITY_DN1151_c0_g1_i1.p1  ORF type:complete len:614 (-),score=151.06 TRINITY_DN1151_c0_g1_i1:2499-4340(-)
MNIHSNWSVQSGDFLHTCIFQSIKTFDPKIIIELYDNTNLLTFKRVSIRLTSCILRVFIPEPQYIDGISLICTSKLIETSNSINRKQLHSSKGIPFQNSSDNYLHHISFSKNDKCSNIELKFTTTTKNLFTLSCFVLFSLDSLNIVVPSEEICLKNRYRFAEYFQKLDKNDQRNKNTMEFLRSNYRFLNDNSVLNIDNLKKYQRIVSLNSNSNMNSLCANQTQDENISQSFPQNFGNFSDKVLNHKIFDVVEEEKKRTNSFILKVDESTKTESLIASNSDVNEDVAKKIEETENNGDIEAESECETENLRFEDYSSDVRDISTSQYVGLTTMSSNLSGSVDNLSNIDVIDDVNTYSSIGDSENDFSLFNNDISDSNIIDEPESPLSFSKTQFEEILNRLCHNFMDNSTLSFISSKISDDLKNTVLLKGTERRNSSSHSTVPVENDKVSILEVLELLRAAKQLHKKVVESCEIDHSTCKNLDLVWDVLIENISTFSNVEHVEHLDEDGEVHEVPNQSPNCVSLKNSLPIVSDSNNEFGPKVAKSMDVMEFANDNQKKRNKKKKVHQVDLQVEIFSPPTHSTVYPYFPSSSSSFPESNTNDGTHCNLYYDLNTVK